MMNLRPVFVERGGDLEMPLQNKAILYELEQNANGEVKIAWNFKDMTESPFVHIKRDIL